MPGVALFGLGVLILSFGSSAGAPQGMIRYILAVPAIFLMLAWLGRRAVFDRVWVLASTLLMGMLVFISIAGVIIFPFFLELVKGYRTEQVGLIMMVVPISMGVLAIFSPVPHTSRVAPFHILIQYPCLWSMSVRSDSSGIPGT